MYVEPRSLFFRTTPAPRELQDPEDQRYLRVICTALARVLKYGANNAHLLLGEEKSFSVPRFFTFLFEHDKYDILKITRFRNLVSTIPRFRGGGNHVSHMKNSKAWDMSSGGGFWVLGSKVGDRESAQMIDYLAE